MEFLGDPSNFEDWSVWRNFHEAGRLMTTHFHVFLPSVVYLLFPGSLITVVYFQFLTETFSPGSLTLGLPLYVLVLNVPTNLVAHASNKILHAMKTTVYALDTVRYRKGESLQVLADLMCSGRDCYGGRRPRALAVGIVCLLVYILGLLPTMGFGFEGVSELGMPEWTAVLFTPLLAVGMSLVNLYLVLVVNLVVRLWMYAA